MTNGKLAFARIDSFLNGFRVVRPGASAAAPPHETMVPPQ